MTTGHTFLYGKCGTCYRSGIRQEADRWLPSHLSGEYLGSRVSDPLQFTKSPGMVHCPTYQLPFDMDMEFSKTQCNSCILHSCKSSITGAMPSYTDALSYSWTSWAITAVDCGCFFTNMKWIPWKESLKWSCANVFPGALFSNGRVIFWYLWICCIYHLAISEFPLRYFHMVIVQRSD